MIYGSLFSGIEAASVAWDPLGWSAAWYSEIEKFPSAVLAHHYPDIPNLGDVTARRFYKTNWRSGNWLDDLALPDEVKKYETIDLLVGGSPCQSFSVAGKRLGLDDPRGNLALEMLRIVDQIRPRWLVFENVPGLLSSDGTRDFGTFLGTLGECGYGFAYRVFNAEYFGVPQRRRRVFVVGYLGNWRYPAAVLFERESLRRDTAPGRKKGKAVAGLTANGVGTCGADDNQGQSGHLIASCLRSGGDGGIPSSRGENLVHCSDVSRSLMSQNTASGRLNPTEEEYIVSDGRGEDCKGVCPTLNGSEPGNNLAPFITDMRGRGDGNICPTLMTDHAARASDYAPVVTTVHGRQDPITSEETALPLDAVQPGQAVAFTQNQAGDVLTGDAIPSMGTNQNASGRNTPKILKSFMVRRLTPVECERLQGFPDNYTRIPWKLWNKCQKGNLDYIDELIKYNQEMPDEVFEDCPDGPRYKAIGNSMAVPVMKWIGERIEKVDNLIKGKADV